MEKDGKLPFFYIEVGRNDNMGFLFKIYRKPTNTQRFIINESHHTVQHKMAAFNSMLYRAMIVPMTNEDCQAVLNYIYETARLNENARGPIEKAQKYATIPYFPEITNKVVNIFCCSREFFDHLVMYTVWTG
jgi:hypothetical protein